MEKCKYCGRRIKRGKVICPWCAAWLTERGAWQPKLQPEAEFDSISEWYPPLTVCVMCGKSGASLRTDGEAYCGRCWEVWTH